MSQSETQIDMTWTAVIFWQSHRFGRKLHSGFDNLPSPTYVNPGRLARCDICGLYAGNFPEYECP